MYLNLIFNTYRVAHFRFIRDHSQILRMTCFGIFFFLINISWFKKLQCVSSVNIEFQLKINLKFVLLNSYTEFLHAHIFQKTHSFKFVFRTNQLQNEDLVIQNGDEAYFTNIIKEGKFFKHTFKLLRKLLLSIHSCIPISLLRFFLISRFFFILGTKFQFKNIFVIKQKMSEIPLPVSNWPKWLQNCNAHPKRLSSTCYHILKIR